MSILNYATKEPNVPGSSVNDIYPDIEYEMIPINDEQFIGPLFPKLDQNQFEANKSSKAMKDLLNQTKAFQLNAAEVHGTTMHIFQMEEPVNTENEIRILLPLNRVASVKQTKKYTKILMENGKTIKTKIDFNALQALLNENGFTNKTEKLIIKP